MKTNFKKLAMVAGVTAALAGGSMSAHAVIQAVPAPAALVPLFTTGSADQVALLRIQVPASVGLDDVAAIFGGPTTQPSKGFVNPNLAASVAKAGGQSAIHWIHMDTKSNEINNGLIPVSANDVVEVTADEMPSEFGPISISEQAGYLVLVNESAVGGLAPLFSFTAEAYITDEATTTAYNIPVFPLTDAADPVGAKAPTLSNNVVEAYPAKVVGSPYGNGPIVSPIVSGIRTASSAGGVRIVDLPVYTVDGSNITDYIVWNDRNGIYNGLDDQASLQTPGLQGSTWLYNQSEGQLSASNLSLNEQLTAIEIGSAGVDRAGNPLLKVGGAIKTNFIFPGFANAGMGFVRWAIQPGVNYGNVTGAYAAAVIFRLPVVPTGRVAPTSVNTFVDPANDGYSVFPVDRGFFQNN